MIEFVLVAPLVLLLFAAIVQIALASYVHAILVSCAAEGARAGAAADAARGTAERRTRAALADSLAADVVDRIEVERRRYDGMPTVAVTITARLPLFGLLGPTSLTATGHALAEGD